MTDINTYVRRVAGCATQEDTVKPPISPLGAYSFNLPLGDGTIGGGLIRGGAYWRFYGNYATVSSITTS